MNKVDVAEMTNDSLRRAYLTMVNSDDAWFSGEHAAAEQYKAELDLRGAALYPDDDADGEKTRADYKGS